MAAAAAAVATAPVDYSRLKLLCILEGPGAIVLSHALKCGTNKTTSVTLLDYLTNLPDISTANYRMLNDKQKRDVFTSLEKTHMANDPSCQSFDITLLHKCIKQACENVAGPNDACWQDDTAMEEKLCHRISVDPIWGKKRPHTRNTRIKRVLKEMYQMALQVLLQDRLSLSDEDTERLTDCCETEDLPTYQVLGAFFTLRSSVTNRIAKRKYYIPHKGLLEYYAARHIIQRLQDGLLSESGAIMSLLQGAHHPQTQPLDLKGLRNLFWHVAGLLSTPGAPKLPEAIKEAVNLLAETGAEWNEWLSLVEDTSHLIKFLGHLSAGCLPLLPQSLRKLHLALPSNQHAGSLLAALNRTIPSKVYCLNIHVPMAMVTPEMLTSPLPDVHRVILVLSDVDKSVMKEACLVAVALHPRKRGYGTITFPRSRMKAAEWRNLLHYLAAASVRVETINVSKETITKKEERELQALAENLLQCRFWRHHDTDLFSEWI
ncbi:hypothetical protein O3P69_018336 [Scylla paramamosain]|uniref:Uncharacterized protein n=1 Tax=Scylla paramamosain TaxID=85552 RepID=A0AAW0SIV9_SCYPA